MKKIFKCIDRYGNELRIGPFDVGEDGEISEERKDFLKAFAGGEPANGDWKPYLFDPEVDIVEMDEGTANENT